MPDTVSLESPVRSAPQQTPIAPKAALVAVAMLLLTGVACLAAQDAPPAADAPRPATSPGGGEGKEAARPDGERGKEAEPRKPTSNPSTENKQGERPRPERGKTERPIWGVISKVDDGALYLLIGDAGREVIVPVQPETEVLIVGRKASFADLGPGWAVNIIQVQGLTRTINARPPRPRPPAKSTPPGAPAAPAAPPTATEKRP